LEQVEEENGNGERYESCGEDDDCFGEEGLKCLE